MKKALSMFLAITVIAAAFIGVLPSSAASETPITATPLPEGTIMRGYKFVKAPEEVFPLQGFTTAKGLTVRQNDVYAGDSPHESADDAISQNGRYIGYEYKQNILFGASDGLIIYVKTDAANKISLFIGLNGVAVDSIHPRVGADYQYAALGESEWKTAEFEVGSTNNAYLGVFSFDNAFNGYVKIPYSSLGSDRSPAFVFNPETDKVSQIVFRFKGLGQNGLSTSTSATVYGTAVIGPVFTITADSNSTKIEVPEEYRPSPVKVKPINDFKISNVSKVKAAETEIDGLYEKGIRVSSETEMAGAETDISKNPAGYAGASFTAEQRLNGTTGVLLYIKTGSANSIAVEFGSTGFGWGSAYGSAGSAYWYMPAGDYGWTEAKFGKGMAGENSYGTIDFDAPFEGYVKIPYSSLFNSKGGFGLGKFDPEKYTFNNFYLRSRFIGGQYGSYTAGPIYLITEDSASCTVDIQREDIIADTLPQDYYSAAIGEKQLDGNGNSVYDENGRLVFKNIALTDIENGGFKLSSKTDSAVIAPDDKVASSNTVGIQMNYESAPLAIGGAEGIMLYIELSAPNTVVPSVSLAMPESGWGRNYNPQMGLKPDSFVYVLSDGGEWNKMQVRNVNNNASYFGGLVFETAFKGWIRLPFAELNNDGGWTVKPSTDAIQDVAVRFKGVGGEYGDIILSRLALMMNGSLSSVINEKAKVFDKGDVNHDGIINASDITVLRKHLLGLSVKRCCEPNVRGEAQADIRDLVHLKKQIAG